MTQAAIAQPLSAEDIFAPQTQKSGMDRLRIVGGQRLNGTIEVSGAKNAALPLMCATLLSEDALQFTNMPTELGDIRTLVAVLQELGTRAAYREDGVLVLQTKEITSLRAPYDLVRKMRASVLVLGPMLARNGEAEVSLPGGCAIGTRPIDLHLDGLKAMGAEIKLNEGYVKATAKDGLKGAHITFPKVSVGATENLMMAATLAKGETILENAAMEPEIVDLGDCLIAMGAKIEGLGTATIKITGVDKLHGCVHDVIADRIEAGTWMIGVCLTGGTLRLEKMRLDHLNSLIGPLKEAGLEIEEDGDAVICHRNGKPLIGTDIMTEPFPGFPTDLQAQMMALLCTAEGTSVLEEKIFENRFMHAPELIRMGARIDVHGGTAKVTGVKKLKGAPVMATDLRASISLILAGLAATGETTVSRVYHLDRGYEHVVSKLRGVGADIERISSK